MAARAQGEYTPSEPESSSEDEEDEGEVDSPPLSPLHETLSPFEDIISRQGGVTVSMCQPKRTRTETRSSADLPQQPRLTLVSPNSRGSSVVPVLMEPSHLLGISQVPSCSSTAMIAMTVTAGSSSSSLGGTEPLPKKAHFRAFLQGSSWYVYGVICHLCASYFSYSHP
jgi:hypothetical protein